MYRFLRPALAPALLLLLAFVWMGCDSDDGVVGVDPDATTVEFASSGGTAVPADSIATLNVRINNPTGSAVTVEVLFAEGASSATPDDIGGVTVDDPITVSFPASASSGDTQSVEVDVSQADITGGAKEARFALQRAQSDSPVRVGNNREFGLSIGFPNIADIRGRLGGTFTFQAIVTSIRGDDTSIQDDTGGLVVSRNSDFADAVSVGDQVIITGTITDFDGLRQVDQPENLASFDVVSSGNPLPEPLQRTIPELDTEDDENMRVRVNGLQFTDSRSTFVGGGAEGNFSAEDEDGNSIIIRVESSSFYVGQPVPQGTFDFEGVFATFRGTGQLNAHDEGDLIFDEEDQPDDPGDDPDAPEVISIADAIDTEGTDEVVAVEGLVTRVFGGTTVIEDGTAGIVVSRRDDVAAAAEVGDELRVIGSVGQFRGLFQLDSDNVEEFDVLSSGNDLPDPLEIGLDEVGDFQSRLVAIGGLEITGTDATTFEGGTNYDVTDGSTTITLRIDDDSFYAGEPIPDGPFDFRGITGVFNDPQIFALLEGDIEEAVEPTELSIADAKDTEGTDELVAVTGTVTRVFGRSTVIQDDTGGIVVSRRQDVADAAASGDELRVVGTVSTFNGLFQLDSGNVEGFEVLSSGNPLPDPVEITLDQVGDLQSELVLITGVEITDPGTANFEGGTNYDVTDGSTTITLRIDDDSFYVGEPIPDGLFDFRGITGEFNSPQIFPLIEGDITEQ